MLEEVPAKLNSFRVPAAGVAEAGMKATLVSHLSDAR